MTVKRVVVLLALFLLAGLLVSACVVAPAPAPAQPAAEEAAPAAEEAAAPQAEGGPKRGGVLKHALPPITTLDPAFLTSVSDDQIGRYWSDFLVYVDENLQPDWDRSIATGYEVNEDGTVWTFPIRQNVTFHNGRPLVAEDVVFTFNRLRDPAVGAATAPLYANITNIEAVDDHTVRFTLEKPNPDFITYDLNDYHALIMDRETEDFATTWNGTGPFMIESYLPEDRLIMTRNPNYWMTGEDGQSLPYLDGLEFIFLSEPSAQVEALRGGQVHWINYVSPEFVDTLEADPNVEMHRKVTNFAYIIRMRSDQPPFDDVRVRQAVKAATDHQELFDVVALGYGAVGHDTPFGPAMGDFYLDIPDPAQDVEKAKALLAEAGYADGLEFELTTQDALAVRSIATVWAEQLAEAGITVNIQVVPIGTYYGDLWLEAPVAITDWGPRVSPQPYLLLAYMCNAEWNESHWCDPELDELALQAGSELDHQKRVELYHQIQEIFIERGPIVTPYFGQNMLAYRSTVEPGLESGAISTAVELRHVWLNE